MRGHCSFCLVIITSMLLFNSTFSSSHSPSTTILPLGFPPSLFHRLDSIKPINHLVIDWTHWECLNLSIGAREARPDTAPSFLFCIRGHGGDIYMKGTDPSHRRIKRGKERAIHGNHPRTIKGDNNRYFQGTKLQVIFRREALVGPNTTVVPIYTAAFFFSPHCRKKVVKAVFVVQEAQPGEETSWMNISHGCCSPRALISALYHRPQLRMLQRLRRV